jgi:hypothetical protein
MYALENDPMKYLRLELKVCEGCGTLWLRKELEPSVYCTACTTRLATFPPPRGKHRGGRPRTATHRPRRRCTSQYRSQYCSQDGAQ